MTSGFIEAIRQSHTERVAAYLLAGVDPNFIEDQDCVSPLHHAAQCNNPDVIEILLISGADIFAQTIDASLTPIEIACLNENWVVAALLAHYQQYLYLIIELASYLPYDKS